MRTTESAAGIGITGNSMGGKTKNLQVWQKTGYTAVMEKDKQKNNSWRNTWLGPPVSEMRRHTGLSQAKFAEKYGISRRTLESWERSEKDPESVDAHRPPLYAYQMLHMLVYGEKFTGKE